MAVSLSLAVMRKRLAWQKLMPGMPLFCSMTSCGCPAQLWGKGSLERLVLWSVTHWALHPPRFAHRLYAEVGLGIDFTARDLQREAIANGWPWERAKGFDYSAAVAPQFVPVAELGDIRQLHFTLEINGEVRQRGYTGDMIFGVDELLSHVSRYITYRTGDLFFTGTPAGAGPVERGDVLRATLEGRELLNFEIR